MNIMDIELGSGEEKSFLHDVNSSACLFLSEFLSDLSEKESRKWCDDFLNGKLKTQIDKKLNEWNTIHPRLINRNFGYDMEFIALLLGDYLENRLNDH
jgi:hypothetical protein